MSLNRQIKASQSIPTQTICTALQHHRCWSVELQDIVNNSFEYIRVVSVGDAFFERYVHRVVAAVVGAQLEHVAGAREKGVAVFVK